MLQLENNIARARRCLSIEGMAEVAPVKWWKVAPRKTVHAQQGTHSLRRTKASMIYKATGNIRAIQILLGHSKIENTVHYLGVDLEDALLLAERTEI